MEDRRGPGRVVAQWAVGLRGTERGHLLEGTLEPGIRMDPAGDGALSRIDGAVEQHRAYVLRELFGVDGTQTRSVTLPEEGQLLIAERGPQDVDVPGRITGADTGQDLDATRALGAPIENVLGVLRCPLHGGALCAQQDIAPVRLRIGEAIDGGLRAAHAAGVETDEVKTFGQPSIRKRRRRRRGGEQPRTAGPAGVDHQRADGLAAGGHPCDGQARGPSFRILVIQRHFQASALHGRRQGKHRALDRGVGIALAGLPGDLLRVESIQTG